MKHFQNTMKKLGLSLAFATAGLLANCGNAEEEVTSCTVRHTTEHGHSRTSYVGEHTPEDCIKLNAFLLLPLLTPPEEGSTTPGGGSVGGGGDSYIEMRIDGDCEFRETTYINGHMRLRERFHVFMHYAHGEKTVEQFDTEGRLTSYQTLSFSASDRLEAQDVLGYVNYDRCARGLIN